MIAIELLMNPVNKSPMSKIGSTTCHGKALITVALIFFKVSYLSCNLDRIFMRKIFW